MQIDDNTLAAARSFGVAYAKRPDEHRSEADAALAADVSSQAVDAPDPELVRQLGLWLVSILTPIYRSGEGTLVGEAIERFGKQLGDAITEAVSEGRYERVEKTDEDRLLDAARKDISSRANVVGVLDGSAPGEFLVLTFQEAEDGDQAMTLEQWTVAGPTGEKPGEFMVAFRPTHLEALSYTMTEARKLLEREGKVAVPGTEN